jgi:hypothetical protein
MLPVGFEPAVSAVERPQTYGLDRAATGTGIFLGTTSIFKKDEAQTLYLPNRKRLTLWGQ